MQRKKQISRLLLPVLLLSLSLPAAAYDSAGPGYTRTLSGGAAESFLIDAGGSLWAWGANECGQLGDGTTQDRAQPVQVMDGVRSVSAGESHVYAVMEDNTLWAWGRNVSDTFPSSSDLISSSTPVKIMEDVASASTGVCTHLAVKTDGSLWTWGRYVGDRTNRQRPSPVKIMDRVTAACTGFGHSLALKTDGSLWAWGQNTDGGVGDGTTRERPTPVKVMDGVVQMTAGYGFSAAVKADGTLWTWGRNWQGELGDGTTESRSTPKKIMDHVVSVHASNNNIYALREDGSLWAWGNNRSGDVGDGTAEDRLSPVRILEGVEQVSAGWDHVLARKFDGTLWTWGSNVSGQLGNGESLFYGNYIARFSAVPIQVMEAANTAAPSLSPPAKGSQPAVWARTAVDEAIAWDFLPVPLRTRYNQTITRGEFCALAVRFYECFTGQEVEGRVAFNDTEDVNVEKAAALGVVSGVGNGRFSPDAPLNREQAALILANLAKSLDSPLPQSPAAFGDVATISPWAQAAVGQVQGAKIMNGVGGNLFAPRNTYTREQSVVTIMNLYRFITQE